MSITFMVHAETREEFDALESEGAPSCNFSNTNAFVLFDVMRIEDFDYCGTMDADELIGAIETALTYCGDQHIRRLEALLEVARAADRLGREVSWA